MSGFFVHSFVSGSPNKAAFWIPAGDFNEKIHDVEKKKSPSSIKNSDLIKHYTAVG